MLKAIRQWSVESSRSQAYPLLCIIAIFGPGICLLKMAAHRQDLTGQKDDQIRELVSNIQQCNGNIAIMQLAPPNTLNMEGEESKEGLASMPVELSPPAPLYNLNLTLGYFVFPGSIVGKTPRHVECHRTIFRIARIGAHPKSYVQGEGAAPTNQHIESATARP